MNSRRLIGFVPQFQGSRTEYSSFGLAGVHRNTQARFMSE
jgi:hypothetical protein